MPKIKFKDNPYLWAIIIFISAAFFRLLFLDLIDFKYDQTLTLLEIIHFLQKPYLITGSISPISLGIYYFPLSSYLFIPLIFISKDPMVLSFMMAFINTLAIVIFYATIRKFYGNSIAIFSAIFLSFSPWSITISRTFWMPNFTFVFSIIFLYFFHKVILTKEKRYIFLFGLIASFLVQIHPIGLLLVLISFISLFVYKIKISFKKLALGLLTGLIFAIPYLLRFQIPESLVYADGSYDLAHFVRPLEYLSGLGFEISLGDSYRDLIHLNPILKITNLISVAGIVLILLGLYVIFFKKKKFSFLAVFILFYPLTLFLIKSPSWMYYYLVLSPITAILYGIGFQLIFEKIRLKVVSLSLLSILIVANIVFIVSFYRFVSNVSLFNRLFAENKIRFSEYMPVYKILKNPIEKEIAQYRSEPYYDELRAYALFHGYLVFNTYPKLKGLHTKLGEFFQAKNQLYYAAEEFRKETK